MDTRKNTIDADLKEKLLKQIGTADYPAFIMILESHKISDFVMNSSKISFPSTAVSNIDDLKKDIRSFYGKQTRRQLKMQEENGNITINFAVFSRHCATLFKSTTARIAVERRAPKKEVDPTFKKIRYRVREELESAPPKMGPTP